MEIYLAHTQGFCAGVASAIETVERALKKHSTPLYVFHEIVHNTAVVEDFKQRGVIFVDNIDDIPKGSRVVFSAHGVAPDVVKRAGDKNLHHIDATCLLVTKVHKEAMRFSQKNMETILIGHRNHEELTGTSGYVKPELLHIVENEGDIDKFDIDPISPVGYITQTTLSVTDADNIIKRLRERFPNISAPSRQDICYATQNRQDAVRELAKICDVIIICGSSNSSNSNRLRETGEKENIPSYLVDNADEFDINLLEGKRKVGISSGASVPRYIVDDLVKKIQGRFLETTIHTSPSPEKNVIFPIPAI